MTQINIFTSTKTVQPHQYTNNQSGSAARNELIIIERGKSSERKETSQKNDMRKLASLRAYQNTRTCQRRNNESINAHVFNPATYGENRLQSDFKVSGGVTSTGGSGIKVQD